MKKNIIIITGGAGFVGSNLIKKLIKFKGFKIISIDNYYSGNESNHIKNKKVKYLKGNTKDIDKILTKVRKNINCVFHFGEFSRIYQSFIKYNDCLDSNIIGSKAVFNFCLKNKIKLIYSATSASLGNKGLDKNLSPYAFTKSKNLELLENLKIWFSFKYEVIYFYNVYGPNQIKKGHMATVLGIFEDQYEKNKPLTVVRPGTQSRRFTHIDDTIRTCITAWKKNLNKHYSIVARKKYTILQLARLFSDKIIMLPERKGERFKSAITKKNNSIKIINHYGSKNLEEYISNFKKNCNLF